MANNEISIVEYGIDDCKGNLRELRSMWAGVPTVSASEVEESDGMSATCIRETADATNMIREAFDRLLDSTIRFLEQTGIRFEESDNAAKNNVDTITNS